MDDLSCKNREWQKRDLCFSSALLILNSIIPALSHGRLGKPQRKNEAEVELGSLHISHCFIVQSQGRGLVRPPRYSAGSLVVLSRPCHLAPTEVGEPRFYPKHYLLSRPRAISRRSHSVSCFSLPWGDAISVTFSVALMKYPDKSNSSGKKIQVSFHHSGEVRNRQGQEVPNTLYGVKKQSELRLPLPLNLCIVQNPPKETA